MHQSDTCFRIGLTNANCRVGITAKEMVGHFQSYTIPPGHDAWVEGSQPFVGLEIMSADQFAKA